MTEDFEKAWAEVEKAWSRVEGYAEFRAWFERTPSFHDATITSMSVEFGRVRFTFQTFRMLPETDERGYFKLDKHAEASLILTEIIECDLNFDEHDRIVSLLQVQEDGDAILVSIEGISGLEATIKARHARLEFTPGPASD